MKTKEQIHQRQLRVFNAFTKRALAIVNDNESKCGSLADACRLAETALKAIQDGSSTEPLVDNTHVDRRFSEDIARIYNPKNPISEEAV